MARKTTREDFRVVVYPATRYMYDPSEKAVENLCYEIRNEIKRHVDNTQSVDVTWDVVHTCEHCGRAWTEDGKDYNGGCCDADLANAPEEVAQ